MENDSHQHMMHELAMYTSKLGTQQLSIHQNVLHPTLIAERRTKSHKILNTPHDTPVT